MGRSTFAILCALCAGPACEDGHHGFAFDVAIVNIPATVDTVTFGGERVAVAPIDKDRVRVDYEERFPSWDDGVAAGPIEVVFFSRSTETARGMVGVGACADCGGLSSCPTPEELQRESVEYAYGRVNPRDVGCYRCEGGGAMIVACP